VRKNPFAVLRYPHAKPDNDPAIPDTQSVVSDITTPTMGTPDSLYNGAAHVSARHGPVYAYSAEEDIEGEVTILLPPGKKADHLGIKVQFIGRIDMGAAANEGRPRYDFISLAKELVPPGTIYQSKSVFPFHFRNIEKQHESYRGRNVSVRYLIKVAVERKFLPPIQKEHELIVQIRSTPPPVNEPIKMEVGIEECLHIEFEYERRCYHLHDVILGKINFLLVRIKIKHMELAVIRRETSGEGVALSSTASSNPAASLTVPHDSTGNNNILTETQTLIKYEIMDGAPVKGETIPVRLYLHGIPADLTPTYDAVNNRFSVRYFLNLVLVDEEDRRYFKQQEIILWRKVFG